VEEKDKDWDDETSGGGGGGSMNGDTCGGEA